MKRVALLCLFFAAGSPARASVVKYAPSTEHVLSQYEGALQGARKFQVRGETYYALELPDGVKLEYLTPAQVSVFVAGAEAAHQDGKSALHKAADNALIAVLIRGNLVPAGTTELSAGTTDAITAQMLASEVADPTNETIQVLSSKLARLQDIIEKEGGDPDDAVIH